MVLCNLNLQENEAVPVNKTKKRTILATVLRNLKAPFAGQDGDRQGVDAELSADRHPHQGDHLQG